MYRSFVETDASGAVIYSGIRVRMGVHTGRPKCEPNAVYGRADYKGPAMAIAHGLCDAAHGGQVLCSNAVYTRLAEAQRIEREHKEPDQPSKDAGSADNHQVKLTELVITELGVYDLPSVMGISGIERSESRLSMGGQRVDDSGVKVWQVLPKSLSARQFPAVNAAPHTDGGADSDADVPPPPPPAKK